MHEIQVSNLAANHGQPRADGMHTLASFDVRMQGMLFIGCALYRKPDGQVTAVTPRNLARGERSVLIEDKTLRRDFQLAAVDEYRLETGIDLRPELRMPRRQ